MSSLDIRKVGGALGAEILDVDLNTVDAAQMEAIHQAFEEHLVLFFPGQSLSPEGHRRFASAFGELEVVPHLEKLDEDHPEIVVLNDENTPAADVWHADVTYSETPPLASVLHMVECPPVGGDTQWANLHLAYETLSDPIKDMLVGLTAHHKQAYGARDAVAEHPVVRIHPNTGRKSLYVNRIFTQYIKQLSRPESDMLLAFLYRWSEQSRFAVRYRWSPGAVGIWDNRVTLHQAVNDWDGRRVIQRITVLGDKPVGMGEPRWANHKPNANGASDFYGIAYDF